MIALIVALSACAGPEGAVQTSLATVTAAQVGAPSGPPASRVVSTGVGATNAVAGSAIAPSHVIGASAAAGASVNGAPRAIAGNTVAAGTAGSPRADAAAASSVSRVAARGTPEPGVLQDPKGLYSFRIPIAWKPQTPMVSGVDLEVTCDDPNGLLRATAARTDVAVTLESATTIITEALKKNTANYEPVPGGALNAMIGGQPARRVEYYGVYSGTRLHYVSYVIVYNGKTVVTLLFVAQPDNFDRLLMQGSIVLTTFTFTSPGHV